MCSPMVAWWVRTRHVPVPPEKGAGLPKEGLTGALLAPVSPSFVLDQWLITEEAT
jgi:hypothetical protein